jgi:magnesium-transporting ATPase (P-type)
MNTNEGITGIVIYSGKDTKLLQNQNKSRYKQSKVELETNWIVIGMLIYTIIASLVLAWLSYRKNLNYGDAAYYLYNLATEGLPSKNGMKFFIVNFLSNICLNCTFIPISLIVAIECTKII